MRDPGRDRSRQSLRPYVTNVVAQPGPAHSWGLVGGDALPMQVDCKHVAALVIAAGTVQEPNLGSPGGNRWNALLPR